MTPRVPKVSARHVYVALGIFTLLMLGAMGHVWRISSRLRVKHLPLVRASARVKLDATLAHLWFEEILSGDRHESMEEVWGRLASARSYARAMVDGGSDRQGPIVPLTDTALRDEIREVARQLSEFEAITRERHEAEQGAASGSAIDQRYDAVFARLLATTEQVERRLHDVIREDIAFVRRLQIFLTAGAIVSVVLLGIVFTSFSKEREHAETSLQLKVRAEAEAREHLGKLAHVMRVATMSELAAEIAHEIRQPLAAISASAAACSRWVDADETDPAKLRAGLTLVRSEAQRANDVMQRLRSFVEKGDGCYEQVDVNQLVETAVKLARLDPQMRQATIRLDLAPNLPQAEVDAVQIQQVVLNLVRNAVEATQESQVENGEEVVVRTRLAADDEIVVSVVDRGAGIPEEIARQPFRPFVTTKESGMGLGLSICHSIVRAHGGTIRLAHNESSSGADVGFTLPTVVGDAT